MRTSSRFSWFGDRRQTENPWPNEPIITSTSFTKEIETTNTQKVWFKHKSSYIYIGDLPTAIRVSEKVESLTSFKLLSKEALLFKIKDLLL